VSFFFWYVFLVFLRGLTSGGYEILADMLRKKSQYINLTSYEIMFEFLGINARTPE
jgi:hypothetical protein